MRSWGGERQLCVTRPVKRRDKAEGSCHETERQGLQRSLLKGVSITFLNICPGTNVNMRSGTLLTIEGHVWEWLGKKR